MHRRLAAVLVILLLAHAGPADAQRSVAVTFDDLPVMSRSVTSTLWMRAVTVRLLAALRSHAVPATGFVIESRLYRGAGLDTSRVALLRLWTAAGHELGNHTWGHTDLHAVGVKAFMRDVRRGDSVTRRVLAERGRAPAWFRHPYLHTGRSTAVRDTVTARLSRLGYRVAPVTVDGYDYYHAAAYEDALLRQDSAEASRIADDYLDHMERVFAYWEAQSRAIVGREIPQVLLLHANALNARTFDRLATMLRGRGYKFITLAEALQDPAYSAPDTYVDHNGISWLHRWARTRGLSPRIFEGEPQIPPAIRAIANAPSAARKHP